METPKENKSYTPAANRGSAPEPTKTQLGAFKIKKKNQFYNISSFAAYLGWGKQRMAQNYKQFMDEDLKTMYFPEPVGYMNGKPLWSDWQVRHFYEYCERNGLLKL